MEPMYYIPSAVRVNNEAVYSARREADLVMTSIGIVGTKTPGFIPTIGILPS